MALRQDVNPDVAGCYGLLSDNRPFRNVPASPDSHLASRGGQKSRGLLE
ncbi:MAG: hypothetical protein ABSE89_06770 [Sedimentisphaerales bacterium]